MMINKLKITTLAILSIFLANCGGDDNADTPMMEDDAMMEDPQEIIDMQRIENISIITGLDTEKIWKISDAKLDAGGTIIDLNANFNVTDDEFIFSGTVTDAMLEWRPGNAINLNGTSNQETLLDYYLAPINSPIAFLADSGTSITTLDGAFNFEVIDANTLTGVISSSGRSQASGDLTITLTQKTPADYATPPASGLNFSLVTTLNTTNASIIGNLGATGFVGSNSDNSLFIVSRDDSQNTGSGGPEQILKYSLNTNTWEENVFIQQQFITKRLNIINNEIVVFGGQFANTYPLSPDGAPTTIFQHDLGITRFGFSVQGDFAFMTGGETNSNGENSKIRRYNYLTNEIQEIATLPTPRFFGGTEIVNNELFVFGGASTFPPEGNPEAASFIVDLATGSVSNFTMPDAPYVSYVSRDEHLIYVGYETRIDDGSGDFNQFDRQINFGVYNTLDDSFTTLAHNLDESAQFTTINGISILNGKLYVVYGDLTNTESVSIYSADI